MEETEQEYENRETPKLPKAAVLQALSTLWTYPKAGIEAYKSVLSNGAECAGSSDGTGNGAISGSSDGTGSNKASSAEATSAQAENFAADFAQLLEAFDAYTTSTETIVGSTAFELDYTRLFIGSLKMYAPPYASYYIDGDALLYGPTAAEIDEIYAQFGIEIKRDEHDMPDHIRFLLAFMSMLAAAYEKTEKRDFALAYADFKSEYFSTWVEQFRSKIEASTQYPYFKALIDFTIKVV